MLCRIATTIDHPAAEARYHNRYRVNFFRQKKPRSDQSDCKQKAFNFLCDFMEQNSECQYSISELEDVMNENVYVYAVFKMINIKFEYLKTAVLDLCCKQLWDDSNFDLSDFLSQETHPWSRHRTCITMITMLNNLRYNYDDFQDFSKFSTILLASEWRPYWICGIRGYWIYINIVPSMDGRCAM